MTIASPEWYRLRTAIAGHAFDLMDWQDSYSKGLKLAYSRCTLEMDLLTIERLSFEERWDTLKRTIETYMHATDEKTEYAQGRKIGFRICLERIHDIEDGKVEQED